MLPSLLENLYVAGPHTSFCYMFSHILIFPWITLGITYHYVLPMETLLLAKIRQWQLGALLPSHTVPLIAAKNWPVGV